MLLICWAVAGVLLRECCEYRLLRQVSTEFFVTMGAGRLPAVTPWAWHSAGHTAAVKTIAVALLILYLRSRDAIVTLSSQNRRLHGFLF
jgi:hypothetical protein